MFVYLTRSLVSPRHELLSSHTLTISPALLVDHYGGSDHWAVRRKHRFYPIGQYAGPSQPRHSQVRAGSPSPPHHRHERRRHRRRHRGRGGRARCSRGGGSSRGRWWSRGGFKIDGRIINHTDTDTDTWCHDRRGKVGGSRGGMRGEQRRATRRKPECRRSGRLAWGLFLLGRRPGDGIRGGVPNTSRGGEPRLAIDSGGVEWGGRCAVLCCAVRDSEVFLASLSQGVCLVWIGGWWFGRKDGSTRIVAGFAVCRGL